VARPALVARQGSAPPGSSPSRWLTDLAEAGCRERESAGLAAMPPVDWASCSPSQPNWWARCDTTWHRLQGPGGSRSSLRGQPRWQGIRPGLLRKTVSNGPEVRSRPTPVGVGIESGQFVAFEPVRCRARSSWGAGFRAKAVSGRRNSRRFVDMHDWRFLEPFHLLLGACGRLITVPVPAVVGPTRSGSKAQIQAPSERVKSPRGVAHPAVAPVGTGKLVSRLAPEGGTLRFPSCGGVGSGQLGIGQGLHRAPGRRAGRCSWLPRSQTALPLQTRFQPKLHRPLDLGAAIDQIHHKE